MRKLPRIRGKNRSCQTDSGQFQGSAQTGQIGLPTKLCKLPRQSIGSRIRPQCPQVLGRAISAWEGSSYHVLNPYPWLANDGSAGDAQAPGKIRSDSLHREAYLKKQNPSQYTQITNEYLNGLPKGRDLGPAPEKRLWEEMNYGDFMMGTFELRMLRNKKFVMNISGQPITWHTKALPFVWTKEPVVYPRETYGLLLNTILYGSRAYGRAQGSSIGRESMDGQHVIRPRTVGTPLLECADGPGWANPQTGKFDDQRIKGLDGNRYGPLPRTWCKFWASTSTQKNRFTLIKLVKSRYWKPTHLEAANPLSDTYNWQKLKTAGFSYTWSKDSAQPAT